MSADAPGRLDVDSIIQQVAELPDRTSPEDWPEAMLVTADELRAILTAALSPPRAKDADPTEEAFDRETIRELVKRNNQLTKELTGQAQEIRQGQIRAQALEADVKHWKARADAAGHAVDEFEKFQQDEFAYFQRERIRTQQAETRAQAAEVERDTHLITARGIAEQAKRLEQRAQAAEQELNREAVERDRAVRDRDRAEQKVKDLQACDSIYCPYQQSLKRLQAAIREKGQEWQHRAETADVYEPLHEGGVFDRGYVLRQCADELALLSPAVQEE